MFTGVGEGRVIQLQCVCRKVVKYASERLKAKWKYLLNTVNSVVISACCILSNIVKAKEVFDNGQRKA